DRATKLAKRLGIPPVQYGTIKSFALVDLGRFDAAWEALEQEVADDAHPFGQVFQGLGQMVWYASAGGRLADEALVATQLRAGDAEAALAECMRRLPLFEAEGHVRNYRLTEELRIRALLALGQFAEARDAAAAALSAVGPL